MLVLDFDGNLTDVEKEAIPYVEGWINDLVILLQRTPAAIRQAALETYQEIAGDPATHGWRYDGEIMAPCTVDPYLRMSACSQILLERAGWSSAKIDDEIQRLFKKNYTLTCDVPRDGTFTLLMAAWERQLTVRIVTNSHTDAVTRKVERLLGGVEGTQDAINWWNMRVIGDARKYDPKEKPEVGAIWDGMPDRQHFAGFPRPTVIKRPHYRQVLVDKMERTAIKLPADPSKQLVVGDIFELDLALPLAMGWNIGLMANEHTPAWELNFVSSHPRGRVLRDVSEILPYYDGVQAHIA